MIKIAIVENEQGEAALMKEYIERYCREKEQRCSVSVFSNGLDFITGYRLGYDAVFMDIKMPLIDGMEAAEKLRAVDKDVLLIFVTNMAQLAIKGYKVNAMDFVVKPVSYFDFSLEMDKIFVEHDRRSKDFIWVKYSGVFRRVDFEDIYYIEIMMHEVCMHTRTGTINFRGSLKSLEEQLDPKTFSRCNNCYVVNLQYVTEVKGDTVALENGDCVHISRTRKKQFINDLTTYFAGTGIK